MGLYSPPVLKNILYRFLQVLLNLKVTLLLIIPKQNECFQHKMDLACMSICPCVHLYKIQVFVKVLAGIRVLLILSRMTNFRLFQSEEFAEGNFRCYENGRKFFKWLEIALGKGEIAHYEQFLLFPQCFQKTCTADA